MSWVAVGVGVGGAILNGVAGNKAAKAQKKAGQAQIDEQRRQFDLTRQDQLPWLQAGQGALGRLTAASSGDMSAFRESPGYQFNLSQMVQGADRSAAKRGGLYSGGHQADLANYTSGLASQEYGNWWNQQAGLANVGQSSAQNMAGYRQNMTNSINQSQGDIGNARASSYGNWANTLGGIGGALYQGYVNRGASKAPSQTGAYSFGNNTGWLNGGGWG